MKLKRTAIIASITLAFILGGSLGAKADSYLESISAFLDHSIKIKLYGEDFTPKDSNGSSLEPINFNGNTYLPLRSVAEASGMPVKWDEETRTASLGNETIQLNNFTKISFVDIKVSGQWRPSYITNVKKLYSNSFMGVSFEIIPLNGEDFNKMISSTIEKAKGYARTIETKPIEIGGLKGIFVESESDAHSKAVYLQSSNSDEYYVMDVFVEKSKYEDNKDVFDKVISTFRKQR